ncbi:hypothetical protein FOA52_001109 [Chlamydomonas sp. UWO 241]|nr:hypothetical protein FOA52_001109 [Chlamydomonas sp. UWO 241]
MAPEDVEAAAAALLGAAGTKPRWRDADRYTPSHNAQPGAWTPVVRFNSEDKQPEIQTMAWGLVPSWTKPDEPVDHFKMFNARCETLNEKTVFSRLLRGSRRCVVLLDGFFEWKKEAGGRKQPYFVQLRRSCAAAAAARPMYMAGLYDVAERPGGVRIYTYTLVTVDASPRLAWLHDRMPALLPDAAAASAWLAGGEAPASGGERCAAAAAARGGCGAEVLPDAAAAPATGGERRAASTAEVPPELSPTEVPASGSEWRAASTAEVPLELPPTKVTPERLVDALCRPYGREDLAWHPVTPAMSSPRYDKPDAVADLRQRKGTITSFFVRSPPAKRKADDGDGGGGDAPAGKAARPGAAGGAGAGCSTQATKAEGGEAAGNAAGAAAGQGGAQSEGPGVEAEVEAGVKPEQGATTGPSGVIDLT